MITEAKHISNVVRMELREAARQLEATAWIVQLTTVDDGEIGKELLKELSDARQRVRIAIASAKPK